MPIVSQVPRREATPKVANFKQPTILIRGYFNAAKQPKAPEHPDDILKKPPYATKTIHGDP